MQARAQREYVRVRRKARERRERGRDGVGVAVDGEVGDGLGGPADGVEVAAGAVVDGRVEGLVDVGDEATVGGGEGGGEDEREEGLRLCEGLGEEEAFVGVVADEDGDVVVFSFGQEAGGDIGDVGVGGGDIDAGGVGERSLETLLA